MIQRIGGHVAALESAGRKPVAIGDFAVVAAIGNDDGAGILLRGIRVIRKSVVGGDVVQLAGGLIEPVGPGFAAVDADDRALIGAHNHAIRAVGSNPQNVVIFAAWRAAPGNESLAAVG